MILNKGIYSELCDLTALEEVKASILFRIDGNVVESAFKDEYSHKLLRTIQWCKANVDKVSLEMKTNNLYKVTYELNDFCVIFFIVNSIMILTALATQNANLSLLSIEAKRKAQLISNYL
jgi:predicted regulator of Ras-like GTPase activity (Roadblock/LC7/MglB family)